MTSVTLETAQKELPSLIQDVMSGKRLLLTLDRDPVAELVPAAKPRPKPVFGSAKGLIEIADDFDEPLEDFADYMS